jgi:hypothetical protein
MVYLDSFGHSINDYSKNDQLTEPFKRHLEIATQSYLGRIAVTGAHKHGFKCIAFVAEL